MTRPLDRRNRKYRSLKDAKSLFVKISPEAEKTLKALQRQADGQISMGAVIEKLVDEAVDKLPIYKVAK